MIRTLSWSIVHQRPWAWASVASESARLSVLRIHCLSTQQRKLRSLGDDGLTPLKICSHALLRNIHTHTAAQYSRAVILSFTCLLTAATCYVILNYLCSLVSVYFCMWRYKFDTTTRLVRKDILYTKSTGSYCCVSEVLDLALRHYVRLSLDLCQSRGTTIMVVELISKIITQYET